MPPLEFGDFNNEDGGIVQNGKIPDKLNDEDMKFSAPLIPVFSEELLKMLHATDWHMREKALTRIEEEISLGSKS